MPKFMRNLKYSIDSVMHPELEQAETVHESETQLINLQRAVAQWSSAMQMYASATMNVHQCLQHVFPPSGSIAPMLQTLNTLSNQTEGTVEHSIPKLIDFARHWSAALSVEIQTELHKLSANVRERSLLLKEVHHYEAKVAKLKAKGNAERYHVNSSKLEGAKQAHATMAESCAVQLQNLPILLDTKLNPLIQCLLRAEGAMLADAGASLLQVIYKGEGGDAGVRGIPQGLDGSRRHLSLDAQTAELQRLAPQCYASGTGAGVGGTATVGEVPASEFTFPTPVNEGGAAPQAGSQVRPMSSAQTLDMPSATDAGFPVKAPLQTGDSSVSTGFSTGRTGAGEGERTTEQWGYRPQSQTTQAYNVTGGVADVSPPHVPVGPLEMSSVTMQDASLSSDSSAGSTAAASFRPSGRDMNATSTQELYGRSKPSGDIRVDRVGSDASLTRSVASTGMGSGLIHPSVSNSTSSLTGAGAATALPLSSTLSPPISALTPATAASTLFTYQLSPGLALATITEDVTSPPCPALPTGLDLQRGEFVLVHTATQFSELPADIVQIFSKEGPALCPLAALNILPNPITMGGPLGWSVWGCEADVGTEYRELVQSALSGDHLEVSAGDHVRVLVACEQGAPGGVAGSHTSPRALHNNPWALVFKVPVGGEMTSGCQRIGFAPTHCLKNVMPMTLQQGSSLLQEAL